MVELQKQNYENLFPFNFLQNLCHLKLEIYIRRIMFWIIVCGINYVNGIQTHFQGLKLKLKVHLEWLPWGTTIGKLLEVGFMVNFNYLQCIPRKILAYKHKQCFIHSTKIPNYWKHQGQMGENVLHNNRIYERKQVNFFSWTQCLD